MSDDNNTRVIPHELVHKHAPAEALVTTATADAAGWTIRARLPGRHEFHNGATGLQSGYHDPLLVLEALRQCCLAATHLFYGVPLDFRYTVRRYEFAVLDMEALSCDGEPAEIEFRASVRKEFRPSGEAPVNGVALAGTVRRNGVDVMEASGAFGWMPEEQWQLIRAGSRWEPAPQPARVDPLTVGRRESGHVVIGEPVRRHDDGSVRAPVVVDIGNRTFFDHPLDHLPGGLILEAFRQLARTVLGSRAQTIAGPSRLRCDFRSFAELSPVCTVALEPVRDPFAFRGEVIQAGEVRAAAELAFTAVEPR